MVIGGCARNAYAAPRATRDVDLAVDGDPEQCTAFVRALEEEGFAQATVVNASREEVPDVVLLNDGTGGRIDLLFAKTDFERMALARRVPLPLPAGLGHVATVEDLVVYKLISGRPRDMADVHEVLDARREAEHPVDWAYIERWAMAWDVLSRLATARARLRDASGTP